MNVEKPPLGLTPRFVWIRQRINEILEAEKRFADANKPIPADWVEELDELIPLYSDTYIAFQRHIDEISKPLNEN